MSAPEAVRDEQIAVALCTAADRPDQERLFAQCFKKPLPAGGLYWRYDASPLGPSVSLLAREPGGTAISGYACSPRLALAAGDERTLALVGETGDVMTHPAWRKRGFFSRLDRAALEAARARGWACVFGLPNRRSAHIFLELGWERVGTVAPWCFLLRADAAARATRAREGRWRGWFAALDARRCARARARRRAEARALRVDPIARFDGRVTRLSQLVEPRFGFMLRRSAEYLNWRFVDTPSRLHGALGLFDGEELAAYVVVQRPREGSRTGYLVDLLARDAGAQHAALEAGLAELERLGASVVEATALAGSWWADVLARAGFLPSRPESELSVILHPLAAGHALTAAARDTARWYFTDGDRDDETVG